MNKKLPVIIAALFTIAPAIAAALDMSRPSYSEIELGLGYVTDDAFRLGRYTGLGDKGFFLTGNVNAHDHGKGGSYWKAQGTNIGLDSRYLRLDAGKQGRYGYFLEYDQLTNNKSDSARTLFNGVGGSTLTLGAGLAPFEIATERERIGLGLSLSARNYWKLDVAYRQESKDGIDKVGGAILNNFTQALSNTNAALLPEPIDYQTDRIDVSLQYARDKLQFELAYHMSLFDNGEHALTWEDPFNPASFGSQALAPDNEYHQVTASIGYQLPWKSRFTGVLSTGLMTQDQDFQPYSVNPGAGGVLPRSSLDGEVWQTNVQLKLASRPLPKLRLSAAYRYNDRDNNTPVATYVPVIADFQSSGTVQNRPLSYQRNRIDLTANYRLSSNMRLRGGYRYDDMSRDYAAAEREDTDENTVFAKWKLQPHARVGLALKAEVSERDGSNYQAPANENPALRKYHLADRDRTQLGLSVDLLPADNLSMVFSADYSEDDYQNSLVGLTHAREPTYSVDLSYQPTLNITTSAYYTRQEIESEQYGWSVSAIPVRDWRADFDDTVDTFGVGAKVTQIHNRWDVGADLTYSKASGETRLTDFTAPGTEDQFPALATHLTSLRLWALYRYRHNLAFRLGYRYEDYDADNWAYDGVTETSVNSIQLLGEDTQDYSTSIIAASVVYQFD
jgi:MtrB/PioB family decaheme-associated outer membrane protein